jgi:MFS family permease
VRCRRRPLHLSFIVYLLTLVLVGVFVLLTHETVSRPARRLREVSLRPRLSVPRKIQTQFVAPAIAGFGTMALVGFYAAIAPSTLKENLNEPSHAVAGVVFFVLSMTVVASILLTQRLSNRAAMLWALGLMVPSVGATVLAQVLGSMPMMIFATTLCGMAAGLGYRGSLQVVNQIAPEQQRAEVVSSYFICCFTGNALPVIGVGVLSGAAGSIVASLFFAATISVFAVVALCFGAKFTHA